MIRPLQVHLNVEVQDWEKNEIDIVKPAIIYTLEQVMKKEISSRKSDRNDFLWISILKNALFIEVGVKLTNNKTVQKLNQFYRNKNKPTNVLSFSNLDVRNPILLSNMPLLLGDIVIAYECCKKESCEENKTLQNHLIHLVIHGTLHLMGYDHINTFQENIMQSLECLILKKFSIDDPYKIIKK